MFRINVDDFGISKGVNSAVAKMAQERNISSVSFMTNGKYLVDAITIVKENPHITCGLHFNLTTGASSCKTHTILAKNQIFACGFISLFLKTILHRKTILQEVRDELESQIAELQNAGISISHIDSHRHVHMIPGIFRIVHETAQKYNIKTIRVINERIVSSAFTVKDPSFLWNGGFIKWIILRSFGLINGSSKYKGSEYFFSILYTCMVSGKMASKIKMPRNKRSVEIMIHPGNSAMDSQDSSIVYEKDHLTSTNRDIEATFIMPK